MSQDQFTLIESIQYQKCKQQLNSKHIEDLEKKLNELRLNPNPPLTKPLRRPLQGKHTMRFARDTYRLIIQIQWTSHAIRLLYLAPRNDETYQNVMWN